MTALATTTTASPGDLVVFFTLLGVALVVGIVLRVRERRERDGEGDE